MEPVEHGWSRHSVATTESIVAHVAAVFAGLIMMVIGLALGVTMIMLPVGVVIGLAGVGLFVTGLFAPMEQSTDR